MKEKQNISVYFPKLTAVVNQMKICGEAIIDQ